MATFSTNQNRHLFVAKALGISSHKPSLSNVGDIGVGAVGTGNDKCIFFEYKGDAGVIKSPMIPIKNLDYVKPIKAADMVEPLKKVKVALDSTINSGAPVAGQDYLLRIVFRQFYGMSDADQYIKDVAVHATTGMTATQFYTAMVNALNLAFSREINATATTNPYLAFTSDANGVYIQEKIQDWTLGLGAQEHVFFDVIPTTIYTSGDDVIWGTVTDQTPTKANAVVGTTGIGNGHKIADLEWFCAGERGDYYRMMGYPNYIPTKYMVEPEKQYSVLEFHFAFTDTGVNSYRSEKDITIVVPDGAAGHVYDVINAIIDEVEYHTGLTIAGLS